MYLSRLRLDPTLPSLQPLLRDVRRLHRLLAILRPRRGAGDPAPGGRTLFRVEQDADAARTLILVQTPYLPEWEHVPSHQLDLAHDRDVLQVRSLVVLRERLAIGTRWRYRARVNPSKRDTVSGHRIPLRSRGDIARWWSRKAEGAGLALWPDESDRVGTHLRDEGWCRLPTGTSGRAPVTLRSVLVDGDLVVADAARAWRAVCEGVGAGKAYGFGLLSLAPSD